MSWVNVGAITTAKYWQYTDVLAGDCLRIRHSLSIPQQDLPWGFTGLIAQAFNYPSNIELLGIRRLYPYNEHDLFSIINPFGDRSRRIAIRGQRRYQTQIVWRVYLDVWSDVKPSIELRLDVIEDKLDLVLDAVGVDIPPNPLEITSQSFNYFYSWGII